MVKELPAYFCLISLFFGILPIVVSAALGFQSVLNIRLDVVRLLFLFLYFYPEEMFPEFYESYKFLLFDTIFHYVVIVEISWACALTFIYCILLVHTKISILLKISSLANTEFELGTRKYKHLCIIQGYGQETSTFVIFLMAGIGYFAVALAASVAI